MKIRLTFIICTYNGEKRLPEVLHALVTACKKCSQACEIVVIDNASKDNTSIVAEQLLKPSGIANLVLHESQPGKANALKLGFSRASGDLFSVIDDDNVVNQYWCERAINFFDTRSDVGLVGPKIVGKFPDGLSPPEEYFTESTWQGMLGILDLGDQELEGKYPFGAGMTGRTHVMNYLYQHVGTYLADRVGDKLTSGEDHEKSLMFKALGWQGVYLPDLQLQHVIPSSRLNQSYIDRVMLSAMGAVDWLKILENERVSRWSIYKNIIVDLALLLKFSIQSLIVSKAHNLKRRSPVFWRDFYKSRLIGSFELLKRFSEVSQILKNLHGSADNMCGPY